MAERTTIKNIDPLVAQYSREWFNMMVTIWRDKIDNLGIMDTGALRSSIGGDNLTVDDMSVMAAFKFVEYGIFVDAGTGNGYRHGNGGDLEFLDESYRYEHNLGKEREPRRWFSPSWYISVEVIKDKMADLLGEAFVGALDNLD